MGTTTRLLLVLLFSVAWLVQMYSAQVVAGNDTSYVCDAVNQDAGYIKLPNKHNTRYFYWFFESRRDPSRDPLVLWLTGGPGCSSLWAMLKENGPCVVQPDLSTTINPYSWNSVANVIWLDQPTGAGYSFGAAGDEDATSEDVAENLYFFLQEFLARHAELRERALYLAGESYAGHYVPAAALHLWKKNQAADPADQINLQGIAIGNGLTSTTFAYKHALDIVANNSYGIKIVDDEVIRSRQQKLEGCLARLQRNHTTPDDLEGTYTICAEADVPWGEVKRNPYDIRDECSEADSVECYRSHEVTAYLTSPKVQKHLGVDGHVHNWHFCNATISDAFRASGDWLRDYDQPIGTLLDRSDLRVLIYAGDADLVCNWIGNLEWTLHLEWKHRTAYNEAPEHPFVVSNGTRSAGMARTYDRLTFVRVFEAGHMVPMDKPSVALELLRRFLRNEKI